MSDPPVRAFPAPWLAVELEDAFRIEDATGFPVAYAYFSNYPQHSPVAGQMTRTEARRIAVRISALPELQQALRGPGD